jgi:hypothetical protein
MVDWAVHRGTDSAADPVTAAVLQPYLQQYKTWLSEVNLAVKSPLPVPGEFGDVRSNPTQWRAWLALSAVYEHRPDLQAAFPGRTTQASRQMVEWAVRSGMDAAADPVNAAILQPYLAQYKTWLAQEIH